MTELREIVERAIQAQENLRITENHVINTNRPLTEYEINSWMDARDSYISILLRVICVMTKELEDLYLQKF